MSGVKVAELQLLHLGYVWSMEVASAWEAEVEELTEEGIVSKGDVSAGISMQFTPNPLACIFSLEMPGKMSNGQTPCFSHNFLL